MIKIDNLTMQYGAKLLFTDVNLNLNSTSRYGLVGSNGAGKSTFFKIIMKEEEASDGEVIAIKNARIGCLSQDQFLYEDTLIINTVIAGNKSLWQAINEKAKLIKLEKLDDQSGYRLGELEQIIFDNDGYVAEDLAAKLLVGLGIKEELHYETLSTLSGGYKLRVLLAQSLFNNPDVLLLDEPTNHLDIPSIYWLENYLKEEFKGTLLFISHDAMFLNNVSTHILDIDYGEIIEYTGNYDKFLISKQQVVDQKMHKKNYLERKVAKMQKFVDKFRANASRSRQALSRQKQIDKVILPDIQKSSRISPNFNFSLRRPSGKNVLNVREITKKYDDQTVLNEVNFDVYRGDKLVIIGQNGIGKSTLLKILLDRIKADVGSYEWGYETQISYFAQDHHESLNLNTSVLEWLSDQVHDESITSVRSTLGQMLFSQDDVNKNILHLSGGESARLLFAKIILEKANILVLDEPTNHLDIESQEALKKALIKYDGTVILVTHNRDFATAIANRIIALTQKNIVDFKGTYKEYLDSHFNDYLE